MDAPNSAIMDRPRDRDASAVVQGGYKTVMVHLEVGRSSAGLLSLARGLADRFQAGVVGIAACQPMQIAYGDACLAGETLQLDRDTIEADLKTGEAAFREAFGDYAENVEWRSGVTGLPLADYIARQARCADLLITGVTGVGAFSAARLVNAGDLVMQAGRPGLVVPPGVSRLDLKRTVVAWKDTREARRAVVDALPLLQASDQVTVVGLAREDALPHVLAHLSDVVAWLASHGVVAKPLAAASHGDDTDRLHDIVRGEGADLIVAGAYGHNRLREWAFGGVTGDLLLCEDRCALLSH